MNTFDYILDRYNLHISRSNCIEIPNAGRDDIAKLICELGFKVGVEVGVAGGEYSEVIVKANPRMKLYGVDPWQAYENYVGFSKEQIEQLGVEAKSRLSNYRNFEFIEEFSMDAVKRFKKDSLDFVYIDANHDAPHVYWDINEWGKRVRPGGILAGHDFIDVMSKDFEIRWKVKDAVGKYLESNNIKHFFLWGLKEKIPGYIRDRNRSWMVVQP